MMTLKTLTAACKAAGLGAVGGYGAGTVAYVLAQTSQPHVLDFELSGLAGLYASTLGGAGAGALGGAVGRTLGRRSGAVGWLGSTAAGAALGAIGMGAVWHGTFFQSTYIPLDTRLWVGVMMVAAGAVAGALGAQAGKASRTITLRSTPDQLYPRIRRWLSLQQCEIREEVPSQKIVASAGINPWYFVAGGVLLGGCLIPGIPSPHVLATAPAEVIPFAAFLTPGILWFVLARRLVKRRIRITLETAPEGTCLTADLLGTTKLYHQLVGVLSTADLFDDSLGCEIVSAR